MENVSTLELAWAFAFPDTTRARSQPTVTPDTTYIGSQDGTVYALNSASGCVRWTFQADGEVRGAPALTTAAETEQDLLLFGDFKANTYAVDAQSGDLLWKARVHDHPLATITGSVTADASRVYVPVSSSEVVPAAQPNYPCCTFRGALAALNLADGSLAWRTYTTEEPVPQEPNAAGTAQFGPSGAPIWSNPTLDPKRGVVLATTGQNYSSPATGTSDAVIALDAETGEVRWVTQVTPNDAWNGACGRKTANCPKESGPDFDIGASAVLATLADGSERIFAGQKSGMAYAMDPNDNGKLLWSKRVGSGGTMGGVHWGMSTDSARLYVGVSDAPTGNPYTVGKPQPGVNALDPRTGEFVWRALLPYECDPALKFACWQGVSAAISSSPGLVFAGSLDGRLRAFDARSGAVLWTYETLRDYDTVNGVPGRGGAIEADGPVIANGRLYVTSGYDKWGELPGNVLLVFAPAQD